VSQFIDRLLFFRKYQDSFAGGHGVVTNENRAWEDNYRSRWQSDKIVRSTHGVNCTGSCSWKIYVKNGLVTWETQQTDYPRTRPDLPNHEPRGCPRGASYSWYIYSSNRIKYPLVRGRLLALWREARQAHAHPADAWASIVGDPGKRREYQKVRGLGGFVRADWDEVNELIAAANLHTVETWGPDRVVGFSPIPAMSMVSYAAGTRYLSLLGGTCLSFYDWYCDLPPSSPQTFGEQTDVPESADWYNAGFLILWGSNVSMTRTPDAHFYTESRYRGAKSVVIAPDFIEVARFADLWLHPRQGTDAALAMAMGHVILKEFHLDRQVPYFLDYARKYSDLPFLMLLEPQGDEGELVPGRFLRAADFADGLGQSNNPDWKPVVLDENTDGPVAPQGTAGFRWGEEGRWNLEPRDGRDGPAITVVKRDYAAVYDRFATLGPLLAEKGNGTKGIVWDTKDEVRYLAQVNEPEPAGPRAGRPRMHADLDAIETILTLAPETNGHVALKAWQALSKATGRDHGHLIEERAGEKLRFRDLAAQPRPILTAPTWSGIESHEVCYNAGWTNVHELIPWRTLTGRQQLYQDHAWMRDFGEGLVTYRPPIDTRSLPEGWAEERGNGNKPLLLNFLTPHQKWGIHSTFTENLIMLTLARGGPIVWIAEADAAEAGIEDNDWIEAFNRNGALVARAVVSQRIPRGAAFMYHAAERTANVPGSEITQNRGGIHNSVTRVTLKPTHMIGGYAQYS
jgi:nitrate reductase alpha subunit